MEYRLNGEVGYIDNIYTTYIQKNGIPCTIFGNTFYDKNRGYLRISGGNNNGKLLHRLIYCYIKGLDYSNKDLEIHHKNENKIDNRISNLQGLTKSEHSKLHKNGENHPMYNKKHSDLSKFKSSLNHAINQFNGLPFRVCINGTYFTYRYFDNENNRKSLSAKTLPLLRNRVLEAGQIWLPTLDDMKIVYKSIGGEL